MNRQEALDLVCEYTKNGNLVKHMLAVEAAMVSYYDYFVGGAKSAPLDSQTETNLDGQTLPIGNREDWSVCGILHDFDYEKMGEEHPSEWGYSILREQGVSEDIINAIEGHSRRDEPDFRKTLMAKTLFAVDELTGFIVACALVNPNKLSGLTVESILKKFKKKDFAKAVSREDMFQGAKELEMTIEEHIQIVLDAMIGIKNELGL